MEKKITARLALKLKWDYSGKYILLELEANEGCLIKIDLHELLFEIYCKKSHLHLNVYIPVNLLRKLFFCNLVTIWKVLITYHKIVFEV